MAVPLTFNQTASALAVLPVRVMRTFPGLGAWPGQVSAAEASVAVMLTTVCARAVKLEAARPNARKHNKIVFITCPGPPLIPPRKKPVVEYLVMRRTGASFCSRKLFSSKDHRA